MRQIGTLTGEREARLLADHLLSLGVSTQLRKESDAWGVWVLDENRIPQARQEYEAFRRDPDDPRFQTAAQTAESIRREAKQLDSQYRKNMRYVSNIWACPGFRRRPLTTVLIAACVVVFLLLNWSRTEVPVIRALAFSSFHFEKLNGQIVLQFSGFEDILHGEVWRLVTPIFMHFGPIHLLFDLWALSMFGTLVEIRRGTRTLALLVFLSALASNVGQYLYSVHDTGRPVLFGGMSGVVYALFGYVWMKGRYEPEQGMILHPSNVQTMLFWLVLCMTGVLGKIANAAHVVGLAAGIACGLAAL